MKKIICRRCGKKTPLRYAVGEFCSIDCQMQELFDKTGEVLTSIECLNELLDEQLLTELQQKATQAIGERKCLLCKFYKTH